MARGRMISKSLSTSEKYAALLPLAQDLTEFCQLLYPLLVVHTDDFGRLQGDPFTVKSLCYPASRRTLEEFAAALEYLDRVGLIAWYLVEDKRYIQIRAFDSHQRGLHKRTESAFPGLGTVPKSGTVPVPGTGTVPKSESANSAFQAKNLTFAEFPGNSGKFPGNRREENLREEKIPPTPLMQGGRLTRADLKFAKQLRSRVYGRCPHEPRCVSYDACIQALALARKAKTGES